jgi:antitoxin VapB
MTTTRAKLFRNGGSQAVRLPKNCRFPDSQTEVLVHREGRKIILEPVDTWSEEFLSCLGGMNADEELPRIKQTPISKLRRP